MFDLNTITSFVLDIAGSRNSYRKQEELGDLILSLLANDYRIFLFSSQPDEDLRREDFQHPRVSFLPHPMPAGEALARENPDLASPETLWMTEDKPLQEWLNGQKQKLAHSSGGAGFGDRSLRIGSPADLAVLFNPQARVLSEVGDAILARLPGCASAGMLIGVGGPPLSGFQKFTVDLRGQLQSMGCPLVDLLDVSPFLAPQGEAPAHPQEAGLWTDSPGARWLLEEIIQPLGAGKRVFVESLPPEAPRDFEAHLPLFLSQESLVLVMGERLFVPPISAALNLTILLEVSARETARRVYEIPEGQEFDEKFTRQYLEGEGMLYQKYFDAFHVAEGAAIRLSAESEQRLSVSHLAAIGGQQA